MGRKYFLMLFMALPVMANAVTLYVDAVNGLDGNDGKSLTTPKATVMNTISAAINGDTVLVAEGTYSEKITIDKAIHLKSQSGAERRGHL